MEEDNWEIAQNKKQEFLVNVIQPLLPNAKYSETFHNGDFNNPSKTFYGMLSTNLLLKDSIYECNNPDSLIHFTSVQSLLKILENGYFRMSKLNDLDDKSEMSYASQLLETNPIFRYENELLEKYKTNLYCLSSCENNQDTIKDSFMWETYGLKGTGVMIEYSISNDNANLFVLGKVKYGKDELEPIQEFVKRAVSFQVQNELFPHNAIELCSIFNSFHKSKRYQNEKELRLIFRKSNWNSGNYPTIYSDVNRKNQITTFNKIYIQNRAPFQITDSNIYPEIMINKIILGYGLSIDEKLEIAKFLNSYQNEVFNFKIFHLDEELNQIDLTQLSKL
jgi:hypothetical protein